jgi:hypothetical protein
MENVLFQIKLQWHRPLLKEKIFHYVLKMIQFLYKWKNVPISNQVSVVEGHTKRQKTLLFTEVYTLSI